MPKATIHQTGIFYEAYGQGPALILIQGFGGGLNAWFRQVPAFRKHFRVITFDARGIGRSGQSKEPYTYPVMAADVIGLMDHIKIDKAHLLGVSLGGLVAQTVAINYPERVIKLILANTFPGTHIIHQSQEAENNYREQDMPQVMDLMVSLAFNRRFCRILLKFLSRFQRKDAYAGYLEQMKSVGDYSTLDTLQLISAPTLILSGTGDRLVSPKNSEILASKIRNARLVKLEGGSHAFFLEMAGRFNKEILQFLL